MLSSRQYSEIVNAATNPPKYIRGGQALMNKLYSLSPKAYFSVIESDNDCFYCDDKVARTLEFLEMLIDT